MEENIILLGPKAVGKSLISEKLQSSLKKEGLGDYDVLSLDLFFKLCNQAYNEELFTDRTQLTLYSELAQLDPEDNFYSEYREKLVEDREKELGLIIEWTKDYYFPSFADIMEQNEDLTQVQRFYRYFSNEAFMAIDQSFYLMVLDRILKKAKKPLIIDAGGNIGCIHELSQEDLKKIASRFPNLDIKKFQQQVLSQIPLRVYVKPCDEYERIPCPDIHDFANQMYMKNPESYKQFANITVKPNLLFGELLDNYDRSNPVQKIVASKKVKAKEVEKTISDIIGQIKNLKTYE